MTGALMQRREFITLLGGAVVAWPLAARGQQAPMPIVGFLVNGSRSDKASSQGLTVFRNALRETGFVDGRNVTVEARWADGHYEKLPGLAADLVRRNVAAIAALGALPTILAAKAATTTVPIVFGIGGDPVELGLVASLSRPGGNLTGATNLNTEVLPKRLQLMHEVVPVDAKIALLLNPRNPAADGQLRDVRTAARTLGRELQVVNASTEREIEAAFVSLAPLRVGGLVVTGDGIFVRESQQIAAHALRHAMPAIFQFSDFTAAGGLMTYGADFKTQYRVAGTYIGRILKGEKPADMPVQQATRIELIINMRTAKALGLDLPIALLVRADEVIE
jgi:putative tryptophan/tyrosine transport system substrate-binding protein